MRTRSEAHDQLAHLRRKGEDKVLVISGASLEVSGCPPPTFAQGHLVLLSPPSATPPSTPQVCLTHYRSEFVKLARQCPSVVCCRCLPTHKAQIVNLIKAYTKRPTCAVGKLSVGQQDISEEGLCGLYTIRNCSNIPPIQVPYRSDEPLQY